MLQVMTAKGLTAREAHGTQHVYRARQPEGQTQRRLVRDLLDRAFGGSTSQLVMQALAAKRATPEELEEIRRLLAGHDAPAEEKDHD
jgi:BlaI family penicillinase repressor